jgi:hypothetical protein
MGCYLLKREEWEANFWNNVGEFPNDGSKKSEDRKMAFEFACRWLDSNIQNRCTSPTGE